MNEHPLEFVYLRAKESSLGIISTKEAISALIEERYLNPNSADMVIRIFQKLLLGEEFKRTLSLAYFEYFLQRIYEDLGVAKLDLALKALNKHILYIKNKGDSKVSLKLLVAEYSQKILINESAQKEIQKEDEVEQEEIAQDLKNKSKNELVNQLKEIKPSDPELVIVNGKAYKRDNKAIALIKLIRGYKCQICSTYILKANGKKYIEAAHIIPKSLKGPETSANIILLCPNHHKEFDFGKRKILLHDNSKVHFLLNDNEFSINFE